MKALTTFVLVALLGGVAAAQNSRYDNIAMGTLPGGNVLQALPNAIITVTACSSMSNSCTTSASLCSSITDTNCNGSNTVRADAGGNFHFYAKPGRYSISIQAPSFAGFTIPDVILPISASDGGGVGTSVTVNGTAAVPNALNFNANAPLPPSGSTIVQWGLNGNNVLGYITGGGGGGGGGTPFTVNGVTPTGIVNFNASTPLPPPNGINVNWTLVGTNLTAAVVGDGNPNSCLLGTGIFAQCPGGGGGGAQLPLIPVWNLFASTGAGGAQDSGVAAQAGFVRAQVVEASGATGSAPSGFTPPNGSIEYFPTGMTYGGVTVGAANGVAAHFSHSGVSGQAGNGGIALAGGNSGGIGTSYQIYLDCEQATGCVSPQLPLGAPQINVNSAVGAGISMTGTGGSLPAPVTGSGGIGIGPGNVPMYSSNGGAWTAIGSGGAAGVSSINGTTGAFTFTGSGVACGPSPPTTCTFSGGGTGTTLPTIAQYNLYASNGSGGAQDTGVQAQLGFLKGGALISGGTSTTSPFTGGNAALQWYGPGPGPGNITTTNGVAAYTAHSPNSGSTGNGDVELIGDNVTDTTGATAQVYLHCSTAGCDFGVPVTQNGSPITGGGAGGGGGAPNQTAPITGTPPTATITSTIPTGALVWACWDGNTPANAIYPSNVSLNPTTSTITFTFLAPQTGYCAINGTGSGPQYVNSSLSGLSWSIPATTHNLGAVVNVRTYDSAGNEIFGNTQVDNLGNVTVTWLMAQAGKVVISQ